MDSNAHLGPAAASRWERRPWLAATVRVLAWGTPVTISALVTFVASRLVHRPTGFLAAAGWWLGLLAAGTAVMFATERLARRLLPLAALLRLSLAFPDAAPSRFGVVLRAGNGRRLEQAAHSGPDRPERSAGDPPQPATAQQGRSTSSMETDTAAATAELARLVGELHRHDRRTRGHAERVRAYSVLLGQELRLDQTSIDRLQWGALLHDIGKTKVPTEILNKPARLDEAEFQIIRSHPGEGAHLLEPLRWWLGEWADAAGQHHERYDGTGYPLHLAGTEISYAGRIVAVADAYDVMTATRSYKKPLDPVVARTELTRCAGTHFDPVVVRAFLSISIGRLERAGGALSWLTNIPILGSAPLANAAAAAAAGTAAVLAPALLPTHRTVTSEIASVSVPDAATPVTSAANELDRDASQTASDSEHPSPLAPDQLAATDPTLVLDTAPPPSAPPSPTTAPTAPPGTDTSPQPVGDRQPTTDPAATDPSAGDEPTTTTAPPASPTLDPVVTPLDLDLGTMDVPRGGFRHVALLAMTGSDSLLYGACDAGRFEFDGTDDPQTIKPLGATTAYRCEFQADQADGTTVRGSFTVQPT